MDSVSEASCISPLLTQLNASRARLKKAIHTRQLEMWYQPIVVLQTGHVIGAEALIRWPQPDGRLLSPDSFIPFARETQLLSPLTQWVIGQVFSDLGAWLRQHPQHAVSINVEPEDLQSPELLSHLTPLCHGYGVRPQQIALEITESSTINPQVIAPMVERYRQAGHAVYLDDFGSGYANLNYLQTITFDVLKIDKTLVDPLPGKNLLPQVIDLARSLSMEPLAEGVETQAQAAWLKTHGVKYAQGWLYSKALTSRAFMRWCEMRCVTAD
ncbi:EAL domain-containing protein [Scandinavium sp.]|uniref:EAL domain-containing protein n=1 Tax=Scandinavium sp. TaxID=2830653 RepID=UPI0028A17BD4|nr:EAL domain-containing protein [Scandinavium sp.]